MDHYNASMEREINQWWQTESTTAKQMAATVRENGSLQSVFEQLSPEQRHTIFAPESGRGKNELVCCCMDGRLCPQGNCLRDAGMGILRADAVQSLAETMARQAIEAGVDTIRIARHAGCGAEGVSGKTETEIAAYHSELKAAVEKVIKEAQSEIVVELDMQSGATAESADLRGPHVERACYYLKDVPALNLDAAKFTLVNGFVISSAAAPSPSASADSIALSLTLALEKGMFAAKFTEDEPFFLVAVGKDQAGTDEAARELEIVKQQFVAKQDAAALSSEDRAGFIESLNKRIVVTGLTA